MCQTATGSTPRRLRRLVLWAVIPAVLVSAQAPGDQAENLIRPEWRRIGNAAVDVALASVASGPVERVWFSADGSLFVRTPSGRVFKTADRETWVPAPRELVPPAQDVQGAPLPEAGSRIRAQALASGRLYAMGRQVYRSDDGGLSWSNLTAYRRRSIIGGGMRDLAVSPSNPEELAVANDYGVWRSVDGGLSWSGLNDALPNLPVRKLLALPGGTQGLRILADGLGALEWPPGEKQAWRPVADGQFEVEAALRRALSATLSAEITAVAVAGDFVYAGAADGRIWTSSDRGRSWRPPDQGDRGPVESLFVDPQEPRVALAALGAHPQGEKSAHVLRTTNGGLWWDDLTADLPDSAAHGITADLAGGAIYIATDHGVFFTRADLLAPGPARNWTALAENLPAGRAMDVKLDAGGDQLFVALDGFGIYAAMAPHRLGSMRLVNAADFSQRAAAPGSLLSVLGGRVRFAQAGDLNVPVLAASENESQIQIPFEANGNSISLALRADQGNFTVGLPLENVSPAIFVDRDGTPLLLNADTGVLLDAMNPARSNSRVQILAAGLGKVRPSWPTGLAAPVDNPPEVAAPVRAYLDRVPVEVTRAILAPGYIGFYLVEVQLPEIVNAGPAELYLESENKQSNRVRVYLEP